MAAAKDHDSLPQLQPTREPFGNWFEITNFNSTRIKIQEPFGPVFINKNRSGKVTVQDDFTRVSVTGPFPDVLVNYRENLIAELSKNPHSAPQVRIVRNEIH